jgi:serine/threonine protein kinase
MGGSLSYNGWEPIGDPLGKGAQGTVYKARSPQRVEERKRILDKIAHRIRQIGGIGNYSKEVPELAKEIVNAGSPDESESLGALKVFHLPEGDSAERQKTIGRLQSEIKALQAAENTAILRLLDASHVADPPFIVTEYFPDGTLHDNLLRFKGQALRALEAFRPLVAAVAAIHEKGAIHRDIKPKNIFVGTDGRLVLGDFGIVFFQDVEGRLTQTYDRAGSRDWMAPWVNLEHRFALEEVNPTLDIFPLGKILWCMISGRHQLAFWYYDKPAQGSRPANNLKILFPDDPAMPVINSVLAQCVVEEESRCLQTAQKFLIEVDKAIAELRAQGQKSRDGSPWLCNVCEKGYYREPALRWYAHNFATDPDGHNAGTLVHVLFCDHCGHLEMFRKS